MRRWLLPGLMATFATGLILQLISTATAAIVASTSVGSTAFVLFASPGSRAARPWNALAGHVLGLVAGLAVLVLAPPGFSPPLAYALAVGLSVMLMQAAGAAHPPAAGTALTVPLAAQHGGFTLAAAMVILVTVAGLLLMQRAMRRFLPEGAEAIPADHRRP